MLYETVKPIARVALTWYYRSLSVAGRSRIPATGPIFLAVNHPNALVDALVVACVVPRRVHFTAKATIFSNPVVAAFLRSAGVIPLRRAADEAKRVATPGADQVDLGSDPNALLKNGTNQVGVGSDPNSLLKNDATPNAKIDPARNADSFRAVSAALADCSAIVIFPEGKSHDQPQLAPLRTGLARMALLARDSGVRGIKIIPLGLLFEQKETPRSRVLIQTGDAIDVDSLPVGERAVGVLTALVSERLNAVTLNFESSEDAKRIAAVSETLAALIEPEDSIGRGGPSLSSVLALSRRADRVRQVLEGAVSAEFRERVEQFQTRMNTFRSRLEGERISAADLSIDVGATVGARFAVREALLAALLLPVSWWGRITHLVPIRIARWLALRGARNRDEPAMNTLLFGVALVLLAYVLLTAAVWIFFGAWWALAFFVTLIPSASSDLRYGDRARRRTERMRAYLTFRQQPGMQSELLAEAGWLRREAGMIEQLVSST